MKTQLLHRDRNLGAQTSLPWNHRVLRQDLALETLLRAMAHGDEFVYEESAKAVLSGWDNDPGTIRYRQEILRDGLANPEALRELYDLTAETEESRRRRFLFSGNRTYSPSLVLHGATDMLAILVGMLRRLRSVAHAHAARFTSDGFGALFTMLEDELTDDYLASIEAHLAELEFRGGVLISAGLGHGNAGANFVLRRPHKDGRPWIRRLFAKRGAEHTFQIAERDEAGARALSELRDRGINSAAEALAQAADQIGGFFHALHAELAFYVGCLNLSERLAALGEPVCFPHPLPVGQHVLRFHGLYDPCLALTMQSGVVGNSIDVNGESLVVITGANQGGKSSFLRSVGVAQLMMQCGMFVAADSFEGELCTELMTHYKREEDAMLKRGKLDEELARMSEMVNHLKPGAMLLFNESFAATNEREGSEIARQIVSALQEGDMRVFFVTHLHAFARWAFESPENRALFLRAERRPDGRRTFRMLEGEPLATAYGRDLYEEVFGPSTRGERGATDGAA